MANRFWVGSGSSTSWAATGNTNWATSSGGSNNASVPGTSDVAIFDGNSGTGNSVIAALIAIQGLDCQGGTGNYAGTITHNTGTNNDKTGYSLTQPFPSNFATLSIDGSGDVTFNNTSIATVTNLTNLPAIPANWLTASGIAASALNGKGDWNIGKTGYTLTQTFPTNFSALGISAGGHVSNVDTLTTYTGNTVQTGDAYARLGAPAGASVSADVAAVKSDTGNIGTAGVGLTNLGDTRIAHLDADVSSRASPTNITAGTITTVTNLTNAPTSGDLTATMKASVTTAATAATPTAAAVSGDVGGNVSGSVVGTVGGVVGLNTSLVDAAISTRLATSGYTAPDNSDITAIKAKTDNLPASPADESLIIAATDALATAIAALPTASQNATALLTDANGVETGMTPQQALRIMLAALAGKASGLATTTATFRDTNDTKNRIVATVDASGDRSAVTLDAS